MKRFRLGRALRPNLAAGFLLLFSAANVLASQSVANEAKNPARMNCGAQVECTTPDGRVSEVTSADGQNQSAAALIMDGNTLSCPLREGHTTFVIKLPTTSPLDRFSFVNENAGAAGELKIYVSNDPLPAASEKWVQVDGHVAFSHKRLFNLSMVGVEARYVKLDFDVEKGGSIAALDLYHAPSLDSLSRRTLDGKQDGIGGGSTRDEIMRLSNSATASALQDSRNFKFANADARPAAYYVGSR